MTEMAKPTKFCTECGKEINVRAEICPGCGVRQGFRGNSGGAGGEVPNYLVQSILVTLFCCLPFGVVGIVYAAQVNGKLQAGDFAGAQDASANAKKWTMIGFWVGLGVGIIYILVTVLGAMASL